MVASGTGADRYWKDDFGSWNYYDIGSEAGWCDQYGERCFLQRLSATMMANPIAIVISRHCRPSGGVYLSLEYE